MARRRRFHVPTLADAKAGERLELSPAEARHARVLRLAGGEEIELFDSAGHAWLADLAEEDGAALLRAPLAGGQPRTRDAGPAFRLLLATALPKGKRAAVLVEKCTELGVAQIVPLRCARSVVLKGPGSAGCARLRRIAAQAAKQANRTDVPEVSEERTFTQVVAEVDEGAVAVLLDPQASATLDQLLPWDGDAPAGGGPRVLLLLVGPEGGFTREELTLADQAGVRRARLGPYVLRVETAAIAACAIAWQRKWAEFLIG